VSAACSSFGGDDAVATPAPSTSSTTTSDADVPPPSLGDGGGNPLLDGGIQCAHQFCQDFDHGEPVAPWSAVAGAMLATDAYVSPPSSATFLLTKGSGAGPSVTLTFPTPAKHVKCGAKVLIDEWPSTGSTSIFEFGGTIRLQLELQERGTAKSIVGSQAEDLGTPTLMAFTEFTFEIDLTTRNVQPEVTFAGTPATLRNVDLNSVAGTIKTATFGLLPDGTEERWRAHMDDAWCDVLP